jgi:hypothetical protein
MQSDRYNKELILRIFVIHFHNYNFIVITNIRTFLGE